MSWNLNAMPCTEEHGPPSKFPRAKLPAVVQRRQDSTTYLLTLNHFEVQ